jgi:hypothetical protein
MQVGLFREICKILGVFPLLLFLKSFICFYVLAAVQGYISYENHDLFYRIIYIRRTIF